MTYQKISPEDPRLSAFAFGEMEAAEREAFANLLAQDPVARALVEELQALAIQITDTLDAEPAGEVTTFPPTKEKSASSLITYEGDKREQTFSSRVYWLGGLAAAASVALLVTHQVMQPLVNRELDTVSREEKQLADILGKNRAYATSVERKAKSERSVESLPLPAQVALDFSEATRDEPKSAEAVDESTELKEAPIVLSPFSIEGTQDAFYSASTTLAGSRLKPDLSAADFTARTRVPGSTEIAAAQASSPQVSKASVVGYGALAKPAAPKDEGYARLTEKGYSLAATSPVSTFSIDVDTASYANVRRYLQQGQRPPREAVRIEEMLNYFPYRYAAPKWDDQAPVAASLEVASAPWNPEHRLVRIGLKAKDIPLAERPATNLVFLLDVSGSMSDANKLPLVKKAMGLLVDQLRADDHVAIVTYAGNSGLALPSTPGTDKGEIRSALEALSPGGGTHGAMGIQLAYDIAKANFVKGGVNRVILCTDGDFNVGVTSQTELQGLIETKAKSGVFLTVLGFGMGNYKDDTLELLADKGNGNYAYVDSEAEARKALVEQAGGTLVTVAKDVKVQVEFNPARVSSYRLIGYENRGLAREDFNNDKVDAGEMGAGHTVTALYEVVPAQVTADVPAVDPLRYTKAELQGPTMELLTLKVRFKGPDADTSEKLEFPLVDANAAFDASSADFKFAAAVAAFGQLLTESAYKGTATVDSVRTWAKQGLGAAPDAHRLEFIELIGKLGGS